MALAVAALILEKTPRPAQLGGSWEEEHADPKVHAVIVLRRYSRLCRLPACPAVQDLLKSNPAGSPLCLVVFSGLGIDTEAKETCDHAAKYGISWLYRSFGIEGNI